MKKVFVSVCVLAFICMSLIAEEAPETDVKRKVLIPAFDAMDIDFMNIGFGVELGVKEESFYNANNIRMDFVTSHFSLVADLAMANDQKYAPSRVMIPAGSFMGHYFFMNEGGLNFNLWNFSADLGRFRIYDVVDSPYSLFINSLGHSTNTLNIKYDGPRFLYQTQWIEMNSRNSVSSPVWNEYHWRKENQPDGLAGPIDYDDLHSPDDDNIKDIGFPDRGANYKIYAVKVKDWRLGFLDAAVYTGRSFDLEYFLNPIPQYFIQYVKVTPGRPWTTDSNENNMFGLFWDIDKKDLWSAYAQVLVDDFSLEFLKFLYDGFADNPWKAAWALGGRLHTPYGRFGFHHGGALKYTFEPVGSPEGRYSGDDVRTAYGYTYYPEAQYYDDESTGDLVSILIEDNMIGYKHGENNIAFQVDYQNKFSGFLVTSELEFSLTGNSSLANPWQDYTARSKIPSGERGTRLLDDAELEKRLEFRVNASRHIGPWGFYAAAALGGIFNKLKLKPADITMNSSPDSDSGVADSIMIWKASQDHEFIFRFSIGVRYTLGVL